MILVLGFLKFILKEEKLQEKAAEALAELISCCISRKPSPNDKLIKNVCSLTCMDPCETPQAAIIGSMGAIDDQDLYSFGTAASKQKSKVQVLAGGTEDRSKVEGFISRRGSELALRHLCEKFGASLFDKVPKLWDCLTEVLKPVNTESLIPDEKQITQTIDSVLDPQILINNIQVISSLMFFYFLCYDCGCDLGDVFVQQDIWAFNNNIVYF